jgi:predicted RNase H-like nuclease
MLVKYKNQIRAKEVFRMPTPEVKIVKPDKAKKAKAWKKVRKVLNEVHEQIRKAGITPEEAERDALEMVRRHHARKDFDTNVY